MIHDDDLLTLAALLCFLQSFDGLDDEGRQDALRAVQETLGSRTISAPPEQIGGYRDAARIVQRFEIDLERWIAQARVVVGSSQERLEQRIHGVKSYASRVAILAAAQTYAEQHRLEPNEELFLSWLAMLWHDTPREMPRSE